jgi:hypothetical protein
MSAMTGLFVGENLTVKCSNPPGRDVFLAE